MLSPHGEHEIDRVGGCLEYGELACTCLVCKYVFCKRWHSSGGALKASPNVYTFSAESERNNKISASASAAPTPDAILSYRIFVDGAPLHLHIFKVFLIYLFMLMWVLCGIFLQLFAFIHYSHRDVRSSETKVHYMDRLSLVAALLSTSHRKHTNSLGRPSLCSTLVTAECACGQQTDRCCHIEVEPSE